MKTGLRKSAYMMIAVLTLLLMAYTAVTGDEILMDAAPSADAGTVFSEETDENSETTSYANADFELADGSDGFHAEQEINEAGTVFSETGEVDSENTLNLETEAAFSPDPELQSTGTGGFDENIVKQGGESSADESPLESDTIIQEDMIDDAASSDTGETAALSAGSEDPDALSVYDSGVCGENLSWKLHGSPMTLTISGTGEMTSHPWADYRGISEIIVEEGVTTLCNHAFAYMHELEYVYLPSSLTIINDFAFMQCSKLEDITIPAGVTKIGSSSFSNCESLREIAVPKSVELIDTNAFGFCVNLEKVALPEGLLTIEEYVFDGCHSLRSITFPDSLTKIDHDSFRWCYSLERIEIPEAVTIIEGMAFYQCYDEVTGKGLKEVILPDNLKRIGYRAFEGDVLLEKMVIPGAVSIIDEYAFLDCPNLTLYVRAGTTAYKYAEENNIPFVSDGISISDAVVKVSNQAYTGMQVKPKLSVTLDGVELTPGTQYKAVYDRNVMKGTATVKIIGKGRYIGYTSETFEIEAKNIKNASISGIKDFIYTGSGVKLNPIVKIDGRKLEYGVDYDVEYTDNLEVGQASFTIEGKGNYYGALREFYDINPEEPEIGIKQEGNRMKVSAKKRSSGTIRVKQYSRKSRGNGMSVIKMHVETVVKSDSGNIITSEGYDYYVEVPDDLGDVTVEAEKGIIVERVDE